MRNSRGEFLETPLLAVADLITKDSEELKVHEFKTSARAYSAMEADTSLQPTCYIHAVHQHCGRPASLEYTVLVKTRTPKIQHLKVVRHENDFGRLGDLVESIERALDARVFYPVENPLNCSTCPYRQPCRAWGQPERSNLIPLQVTSARVVSC